MCTSKLLKKLSGILKIVELVCVIISIGIYKGADSTFDLQNPEPNTLATGILVTSLIITPVLVICYLVRQTEHIQQTFLEILVSFVLFAGLLTIGSIGINTWKDKYSRGQERDEALAMSSFCILGCFAYFADFVVAILIYNE